MYITMLSIFGSLIGLINFRKKKLQLIRNLFSNFSQKIQIKMKIIKINTFHLEFNFGKKHISFLKIIFDESSMVDKHKNQSIISATQCVPLVG